MVIVSIQVGLGSGKDKPLNFDDSTLISQVIIKAVVELGAKSSMTWELQYRLGIRSISCPPSDPLKSHFFATAQSFVLVDTVFIYDKKVVICAI